MAPTSAPAATRESTPAPESRISTRRPPTVRPAPPAIDLPGSTSRRPGSPTDDEILGLTSEGNSHNASVGARHAVPGEDPWRDSSDPSSSPAESASSNGAAPPTVNASVGAGLKPAPTADNSTQAPSSPTPAESESVRAALDANPDLRRAWDDAQAYRETFASPDEARAATAVLADIDRMDALFFSRRPEDHAELARAVAALDPAAFTSLAQAMNGLVGARHAVPGENSWRNSTDPAITPDNASPNGAASPTVNASVGAGLKPAPTADNSTQTPSSPTQAQSDFFHATNAAAVRSVVDAIETQVARLLPENISKSARNRVVGEIYRELDTTLRSNRQLAQQMRDALRSGSLDADHQRAVVSLVTGRARQALPGVAKRVLSEWTSTVVAAHNDRRARQQAAERRIDIAGSNGTGSDGPRSMTPRDVDYKRMSDSDILNL
jgi:hypothetical protein